MTPDVELTGPRRRGALAKKFEGSLVPLAREVLLQGSGVDRFAARYRREQREARPVLDRVEAAQDIRRLQVRMGRDGLNAFNETSSKDRMKQVGARLIRPGDSEIV